MDRRTFLREGMVATAGVGVLATAGCSQVPVVGSGGSGRPYARWLHAPGELTNTEYYGALVVDAATVFDNLDRFEREYAVNVESAYRPTLESAGVAPAAVDKLVETDGSIVLSGEFEPDDVRATLAADGFEAAEAVGDYSLSVDEAGDTGWLVSERALVWLSGTEPVEEMARAVVETSEGDRSRYVDEHTGADVLTSTLSDGFDLRLNPYERATVDDPRDASFEGSVGIGTSLSFDGDEISAEVVLAYEEAADADTDDLEAYVEATRSTSFKDVYDLSFSTSGRAAVVTGKMNPEFMSLYLD